MEHQRLFEKAAEYYRLSLSWPFRPAALQQDCFPSKSNCLIFVQNSTKMVNSVWFIYLLLVINH